MPNVSLQIPILFDVSAAGVVFGEDVSGVDIFDAHLKFTLDNDTAATVLANKFKDILFADASENDVSGVLFYYNVDRDTTAPGTNGSEIANAIQSAILNGKLKQAMGSTGTYGTGYDPSGSEGTASSVPGSGDWSARYQAPGIPKPVFAVTTADSKLGPATGQEYYTDPLCDAGGTTFGRVLIRLMSVSLMGHPFAQAFIKNEQQIIEDISNSDITSQIQDNLLKGSYFTDAPGSTTRDISGVSNVLDADVSYNVNTYASKSAGIHNGILQQMYEQLLGTDPQRFDLGNVDISGHFGTD